jgi:hypothetical protein
MVSIPSAPGIAAAGTLTRTAASGGRDHLRPYQPDAGAGYASRRRGAGCGDQPTWRCFRDDIGLAEAAAARGIGVTALSPLHLARSEDRGLLLGFGRLPEHKIPRCGCAVADANPSRRSFQPQPLSLSPRAAQLVITPGQIPILLLVPRWQVRLHPCAPPRLASPCRTDHRERPQPGELDRVH